MSSADLKSVSCQIYGRQAQMLWRVSSSPHYATHPDAHYRHVLETVGAVQADALYQERA